MAQSIGSREAEIKQLIYEDLTDLAQRAGLKDPRFGATRLIQNEVLPGSYKQQVAIYHNLILNNIDNVEPREVREALCVKLNLCEGYPDSGSQRRLGILGRKWGRSIPSGGAEMGNSKQTENQARGGQKYLASLIRKEIDWRNAHDTWDELLQGTSIEPASGSLLVDDEATPSRGLVDPTESPAVPEAQTLTPAMRQAEPSRARTDVGRLLSRPEVISIPIAPAVLDGLEMARMSCEAANRRFVTPHLLLALLDLPNSRVARCFDQAKPGLAHEWQELLREYQERAIHDETFDRYRKFDWDNRPDVRRGKELSLLDGAEAVDELPTRI